MGRRRKREKASWWWSLKRRPTRQDTWPLDRLLGAFGRLRSGRLLGSSEVVAQPMLADPEVIKDAITASAAVLHAFSYFPCIFTAFRPAGKRY